MVENVLEKKCNKNVSENAKYSFVSKFGVSSIKTVLQSFFGVRHFRGDNKMGIE